MNKVSQRKRKRVDVMNKREIQEIKKQFTPENCAITRIAGCYVDEEKKEVETEFVNIVRVIEDLGYTKKCVYEEDVTGVKDETFKMSMKRILEEYCMEHDGKFFIVYEEICRVKE